MQAKAVNGFTSNQVDLVLQGYYGDPEFRFRAELVDRNDLSKIRDLTGSIDLTRSKVTFDSTAQDIRRSAQLQVKEILIDLDPWATLVKASGPLFFWRLGETAGTTAQDASGNGRTGTYHGGFTLAQAALTQGDQTDNSVTLNGSTGYVDIADASWMDITVGSWEAWVKIAAPTGSNQPILARNTSPSNIAFSFVAAATTGFVQLILSFDGTALTTYATSANVCDGVAHHVVATYDGSFVRIYVDSVLVLKTAQTGNIANVTSAIRAGANVAGTNFLAGTLDEVSLYSRALTGTEIRQHYQAGSDDLRQIDFDRDFVKLYGAVKMQANGSDGTPWAEWPLGIYKLSSPSRSSTELSITRPIIAQDYLCSLLQNDKLGSRWTVSGGENYITGTHGVLAVIQAMGIDTSSWSITSTTKTLPSTLDFDINTSRLDIVNTLLQAINYQPIRSAPDGKGIIEPFVLPENRATEDTLNCDVNSQVEASEVTEQTEIDSVANDIILSQANPDSNSITSEDSNSKVTSATSTVITGRRNVAFRELDAADQSTLDALAQRDLSLAANASKRIQLKTIPRPFHDNEDRIKFIDQTTRTALNLNIDTIEESWGLSLDPATPMDHTLRRIDIVA